MTTSHYFLRNSSNRESGFFFFSGGLAGLSLGSVFFVTFFLAGGLTRRVPPCPIVWGMLSFACGMFTLQKRLPCLPMRALAGTVIGMANSLLALVISTGLATMPSGSPWRVSLALPSKGVRWVSLQSMLVETPCVVAAISNLAVREGGLTSRLIMLEQISTLPLSLNRALTMKSHFPTGQFPSAPILSVASDFPLGILSE